MNLECSVREDQFLQQLFHEHRWLGIVGSDERAKVLKDPAHEKGPIMISSDQKLEHAADRAAASVGNRVTFSGARTLSAKIEGRSDCHTVNPIRLRVAPKVLKLIVCCGR